MSGGMMLNSIIRTVVSKVVGALLGLALAVGVVVPAHLTEMLTVVLAAAVVGLVEVAYYVLGRVIEQRFPTAGKVVLSLGMAKGTPVYVRR
ncbi:hypothetical protein ACGFNU_24355 [Spirillospora sp. NPDC048911]|uniref:hypothetical protein n=1 Tax=Spirillospora sp. NPDC048911 TaxID=3364527 RepID=UPI0037204726